MMNVDLRNILVINFGQVGDVVLSLPAMNAVRKKFPESKITGLVGKSTRFIVEMSEIFDEVIPVDRVALRDSGTLWSVSQIFKLVADIRRRKFDFVIDLHSLSETNLLGFFSGAKTRLFASRGNRSIDLLSNFRPKPPSFDREMPISEFYSQTISVLGVDCHGEKFRIKPDGSAVAEIEQILKNDGIFEETLVGLNIGAGHSSRSWEIDNFAELAKMLNENDDLRVLVFFGPEEEHFRAEIGSKMPSGAIIYDKFDLVQLAAIFSRLKVLVGCDTGPVHLAVSVGVPVVFVSDPLTFYPASENVLIAPKKAHAPVTAKDVFQKIQMLFPQN